MMEGRRDGYKETFPPGLGGEEKFLLCWLSLDLDVVIDICDVR